MKKSLLFPTEVYEDEIVNVDNKILNAECFQLQKFSSNSVSVSNSGGWQSPSFDKPLSSEIEKLINNISVKLESIYKGYGISRYPRLLNYWVNINQPNNYNISHNHTLSFFSCVYYVKVPKNSGDLIIERSDDSAYFIQYFEEINQHGAQAIILDSAENKLVCFPAWVKHSVGQNLSNDTRISIAFNFV
jgi:uncharacterized protein (TIGR02466 family)